MPHVLQNISPVSITAHRLAEKWGGLLNGIMVGTLAPFFLTAGAAVSAAETVTADFTSATAIPLTASGYTATGNEISISLSYAPGTGADLMVVENTGIGFIGGEFVNLAQGQQVELVFDGVTYPFVANYYGGTGNDLVLHSTRRRLVSWGSNTDGVLGRGGSGSIPSPVSGTGVLAGKTVVAVSTGVQKALSSGVRHVLALCSDGTVVAWGNNSYGQLGTGQSFSSTAPVTVDQTGVLAGKTVVAVSAGDRYSLALCSDGTMAAWGEKYGPADDYGNKQNSSVPVMLAMAGALEGKTVVRISAGIRHCVALCSDGALVSWGMNNNWQLGDGTNTAADMPVAVDMTGVLAGKSVISIAAGDEFTLVLSSDGKLVSWGSNSYGQLGRVSNSTTRGPGAVNDTGALSGKIVDSMSVGGGYCLARCSDGTVVGWGNNNTGQLGNGTTTSSSVPVAIEGFGLSNGRTVKSLATGDSYSLALCSDGRVLGWGSNNKLQLGIDPATTSSLSPTEMVALGGLAGVERFAVFAGGATSMVSVVVPADSKLSGLLPGSGTLTPDLSIRTTDYGVVVPSTTPTITLRPVTANSLAEITVAGVGVASGTASGEIQLSPGPNPIPVVVTAEDGTRTSYTVNFLRSMNLEAVIDSETDVPVVAPLYDATGLTASLSLGFAPQMGASLKVIDNTGLAFIRGQFANLSQGQAVDLAYGGVTYHFVANYYGGTGNDLVLEWAKRGIAAWGQQNGLGTAGKLSYRVPEMVDNTGALAGKCVVSVGSGGRPFSPFGLVLCVDGSVIGWGDQGGEPGGGGMSLKPVLSNFPGVLSGKRVIAISSANSSSMALFSDGTMAVSEIWNYYYPTPTNPGVLAGKSVVGISKGGNHVLALCSDGTIAAWGENYDGQLGNGTTTYSSTPVAVMGEGALYGKMVTAVTTGLSHSLALCSDGTLVSWGDNAYGQLGNNSTADSSVPVVVSGRGVLAGKRVVALSQGAEYMSLVLCSGGTVASWGLNSSGQLGRGTTVYSSLIPGQVNPTGVLAGKKVVSVSSGWRHNIAACSDGSVVTWGDNQTGQLGTGSTASAGGVGKVIDTGELYGKKPLTSAAGMQSLVIMAEPDSGYPGWASDFTGISDKRPSADPDADGIPNLVEYALGGHPGVSSMDLVPILSASGNEFIFNFNRLASSVSDTAQVFQYSTDMVSWTDVGISPVANAAVTLGTTEGGGKQAVTVTIPKGDHGQMFGRLQVKQP
jgi:alpha-tubulin suppressor-like RCC1 family protein